jgi:SRSO17 transposase
LVYLLISSARSMPSGQRQWAVMPGRQGRAHPPRRFRRRPGHAPIGAKMVGEQLPTGHYRTVRWREGEHGWPTSRFARVGVRAARRDEGHPEAWLLIEWPSNKDAPIKYWLSSEPHNLSFRELVHPTKLCWRIERDCQELKEELELGHYEGRIWRASHHHTSLCIAAYGFLIRSRLGCGK